MARSDMGWRCRVYCERCGIEFVKGEHVSRQPFLATQQEIATHGVDDHASRFGCDLMFAMEAEHVVP